MKKKKLCDVEPYLFENHLVISLSIDWFKAFNEIPRFTVNLDSDGKLHLISQQSTKGKLK